MVTQNYTISTVKVATPPKVKMSQYDYGMRTITFAVVDGSGAAVDLTGKTVTVEGTRIDGHAFATTCTVADNEATFVDTVDMTNAAGDHPAELVVRQNDERLGTMNFIISVEPAAMDEGANITPEDLPLYQQLFKGLASAPMIYNTVSGDIASFSDGADGYPLKGLAVAVEPKQSGSGDPSPTNIRPISGWDTVAVIRTGTNMLGGTALANAVTDAIPSATITDDYVSFASTATASHPIWNKFKPNTVYTFILTVYKNSNTGANMRVYYTDNTYTNLTVSSTAQKVVLVFTSSSSKSVDRLVKTNAGGTTQLYFNESGVFEGTLSEEQFEEYTAKEYVINIGETVYGGTLDVVGGKMVVDRAMVDLSSSDWTGSTLSSGVMRGTLPDNVLVPSSSAVPTTAIMDRRMAKDYNKISQSDTGYFAIRNNKTIIIPMRRTITVEEFVAEYGDAQLCYPIETPAEITLTPTQINTLLGVNNIYSDAGSISEVEYPADTKTFILNAIASALA